MRVFRFWPLALLALAGCQWVPAVPGVHVRKIDIQQGNAITPEMLSKLRLGMTRSQVRFALGTPLLVDPFRTDRWDYVYSFETGGRVVERRHVTVIFEQERLKRVEGDVPPDILTQINSGIAASTPVLPPTVPGAAPAPAGPVVAPPATGEGARSAPPDAPPPTQGEGAKPPPSEPAPGSNLVSGSAGGSPEDKPSAETPPAAKPPAEKPAAPAPQSPPQEQGFFGRMLETLGF